MSTYVRLLVLSVALGCNGADPETLPTPADADVDGDGVPATTDCDDDDPNNYPGNEELCDGRDNDCDTLVDEAVTSTFYRDEDGDGYGAVGNPTQACEASDGYVADATDCNDVDAEIRPGAEERCDAADRDCDGQAQNDAVDATFWYLDDDLDSFGMEGTPLVACDQPTGRVSNADDCDDGVAAVNPNADELCNGIDDDCDREVDEHAIDVLPAYADADNDGFGTPDDVVYTCQLAPGRVANNVDCDDTRDTVNPDAIDVCGDGLDNDCNLVPDDGAGTEWFADVDVDGFGAGPILATGCDQPAGAVDNDADCNDDVGTINPGATEQCNGLDDDCDNVVPADELDADGDLVLACDGDCDDTSSAVNPAAPEICDGLDNDCDPTTDEELLSTTPEWYTDGDHDGYGDSSTAVQSCTQPAATVAMGEDCDDHDPDANPGAEEICGDGIDNDCNGLSEESCVVEHCGTIAADEVWSNSSVHRVTCDIEVGGPGGVVLTVAEGTRVEFVADAHLRIGHLDAGRLVVEGATQGVTFTSAEVTPTPGAWDGVRLDSNDTGSVIDGLTLTHAGGGTFAGLMSRAPSVTVANSTFSHNIGDGLRVESGTVGVTTSTFSSNTDFGLQLATAATLVDFSENLLTDNDTGPIQLAAAAVGQLDPESAFGGNTTDRIHMLGGVLDRSAVWHALDVPYYASGSLTLSGPLSPELRIEDGAEVVFAAAQRLSVGTSDRARLLVEGSTNGVVFRGEESTPGFWSGLSIGDDDLGTELRGLTLRDGGDIGAGLFVVSADVLVENSIIEHNDGNGIEGRGSVLTVRGTTIRSNVEAGVLLDGSSSLGPGAMGAPSFVDNLVVDNGEYPVRGPGVLSLELDSSSSFSGNADDFVYLTGDILDRSGSWRALDVPYLVAGTLTVQGSANPVLTVEDGVVARFEDNVSLDVGISDDGTLLAEGATHGILFTTHASVPVPGAWRSVRIGANDEGSRLTNTTIEYAGGLTGAVVIANSSPVLEGVTVSFSGLDGIDVSGATARPVIRNSNVFDSAGYGVEVSTGADLPLDNGPAFVGNTLAGNEVPLRLPIWTASSVAAGVFDGNQHDVIELTGGTVNQDTVLRSLGVPFRLLSDTWIQGTLDPTLSIESGVTLQMDPNVDLRVAASTDGRILAEGTELEPILITSSQSPANRGDWGHVQIGDHDLGSRLVWTTIEYGGNNGALFGALQVESDALVLDHVTSRFNRNNGLRGAGAVITVTNSSFSDNEQNGMYLDGTSILLDGSNNTYDNNLEAPIVLPANYAGNLGAADDYGDNGTDAVVLLADSVEQDATWAPLTVPYLVSGNVYVDGPSDPVLTITDGTTVLFEPSSGLIVGQSDDGTLLVDGHTLGVTLTSAATTPLPGDWAGLWLGVHDQGSVLDGLTLTYGGQNNYANLYIQSGEITVRDSTIAWSSQHGIRLTNAVLDLTNTALVDNAEDGLYSTTSGSFAQGLMPTVTGNTFSRNADNALSIRADDVRQLDASSTFTGNGAGVRVWAGQMHESGTWQDLDVPFTLTGSLTVNGSSDPVLTLSDGVELRMPANADLDIGRSDDGGLVVDGGTDGVLITSADATTPGAWQSLRLNSRTTVADITGLTVEYGGGNAQGNLYVNGTDATFDDVVSRFSGSNGLFATGGSVVVTNSRFADNGEDGVHLAASAELGAPFTNNVSTDNDGAAIQVPAASVDKLTLSSTYAGNAGPIGVHADIVESDATWLDLDVPYRLDGSVDVRGTADPLLTLSDGVEIFVDGQHRLEIGVSSPGGLVVDGHTEGVWMGSTTGGAGDWQGLVAGNDTTVFDLLGLTIEDGGGSTYANLYITGAAATLERVTSLNSARDGLYVRSGGDVEVVDSSFLDNNDYGVRLDSFSALADLTGGPSFVGNTLSGNTQGPMLVNPEDLGQLDPSNTFAGNDVDLLAISGGTVDTSAVWFHHDVDYHATGDINIRGTLDPVVTLDPGVTMYFDASRRLYVGNSGNGGLVTSNSGPEPVVFTSSAASPLAGDWQGLYFSTSCIDASVDLQNVVVAYAGSSNGAVRFAGCDGRLAESTISDSATNGVHLAVSAAPTLDNLTFVNIQDLDVAP